MEKIGFIDIYDAEISGSIETEFGIKYYLYIFNQTSEGYKLLSKTENPQQESLKEVSEFYLSLPAAFLNFRILEFPFAEKEKLCKVIPFELDNLIISGSGSIIYDFTVLDAFGDNNKILAAYIDKKKLGDIIKKIASLNIDPHTITSLELGRIIRDKRENIASELVAPEKIPDEDRINSAIAELKAPTINLRTGEFAYRKDIEKYSNKIKLMLILLISLAFIINAILGLRIFITNNEISSIKQEMRNVYSSFFPADKKITDELYQMKSHMKNIKEKADILIGVYPLEHLIDLSNKKSKGIVVEELNLEKEIFTIKGEAASLSDLDEMKRSLSEKYQNVSISDIKPLSENKILFTIIIKG